MAPPWGSVYTDKECVVFGLTTLDLMAWMRANEIHYSKSDKVPMDHIGLMLNMMSLLANDKPEILEDFLQNHLLTWSSHFFDYMQANTENEFYCALAKISKASLEGIQETLNIEVTYPKFYK